MKLAIISDLHLDMAPIRIPDLGLDDQVDLTIIAGDLHPNQHSRHRFIIDLELYTNAPVMFVPGNHDYYGDSSPQHPIVQFSSDGLKFAGATLWTKFDHPIQWVNYVTGLRDYQNIENWTEDAYTRAHATQKRFLLNSKADVIVSHHAPSYQSVSAEFKGDLLNCCFMNDMDEDIYGLEYKPKLWIHGHVHQNHDYMIGETNPKVNM